MELEQERNEEQKVVDVLPLGKWRRILSFLGDFFLNFMLAFLFFAVAVLPLGKVFSNFDSRNNEYTSNLTLRSEILYENKIIFNSGKVDKSEIIYNTSYTYYVYLSYFSFDEENPEHVEFNQYGHKQENDVFKHYFVDILHDEDKYFSLFDGYNQKHQYFEKEVASYVLKAAIKAEIKTFFDTTDRPTGTCEKYMSEIETSIFYPMMSEVMTLVKTYDLKDSGGHSYNEVVRSIKNFESYINTLAVITSFTSIFLSSTILFLIIPLCNKTHKTLTMMIMKIERIDINSLKITAKWQVIISYIYQLFMSMFVAFFVPIGLLTIHEVFNITILFVFGLLGLLLIIASFIFLLFDKFNRSMFDYFTRTVFVSISTLDEIYRSRGYYI